MRAATVMFVYAAVLIAAGLYAYASAPVGANAFTALVMPASAAVLMIICGVLAMLIRSNRTLGMIGIHLGLVLPLLFAAAIGWRATVATRAAARFPEVQAQYQAAVAENPALADREQRVAFFRERGTRDHSVAYLRNTLWFIVGTSIVAFVVILAMRPKPADRLPAGSSTA